jgi:hypothetical protein
MAVLHSDYSSLAMRYSTCTRVRATGMMDKVVVVGGG